MAGGGKSTAAKALEDLGFFVVDNLPPQLLETLISLVDQSKGARLRRLAFVVDAREANLLKGFMPIWERLKESDDATSLVFLGAKEDILLRRFKETRRRHPLDDGDGLRHAIPKNLNISKI